jgi:hypothetical protein
MTRSHAFPSIKILSTLVLSACVVHGAAQVANSGATTANSVAKDKAPRFFTPANIAVWSADTALRAIDASTTVSNLNNPCRCYAENGTGFKNPAAQYSYSLGIVGAQVGASFVAHKLHRYKIEHALEHYTYFDIAIEAKAIRQNSSAPASATNATNSIHILNSGGTHNVRP